MLRIFYCFKLAAGLTLRAFSSLTPQLVYLSPLHWLLFFYIFYIFYIFICCWWCCGSCQLNILFSCWLQYFVLFILVSLLSPYQKPTSFSEPEFPEIHGPGQGPPRIIWSLQDTSIFYSLKKFHKFHVKEHYELHRALFNPSVTILQNFY